MQEARPETATRKLFAANLWRERKARGLSQRALAQLAGLDRTYVGSVERGERNVSIDNIERLAEAQGSSSRISSSASGLENRPKDWQRESLGRLFCRAAGPTLRKRLTHGAPLLAPRASGPSVLH